ncbi:MAG: hypothetical protein IMW93_05115 [Thermoanaerobacteraceae bacterium]|nr:hypothetical protein [Thermoanaerobacteraceae bacterium]
MRIISPGGELLISVREVEVKEGEVIIHGSMGVWDARSHISRQDLLLLGKMFLRPKIVLGILKLLFWRAGKDEARLQERQ